MPEERPTTTPIPTQTPFVDPDRERRTDPERLCPAQKTEITRRVAPHLP